MIIDADTHISPIKEDNRIQVEELVGMMEKSNIDKALVWLQPTCDVAESNQYVYESMREYPDKLLGFGWADPREGVDKAVENAKKCLYEYDFYGVKLNGAQNNYYIDDQELAIPVIEVVANSGKALAFHVGADAPDRTNPARVASIAKKYPDMKIFMVHMGGAGTPDLSDEAITVAEECPNTYLIGSAIDTGPILKAVKTLGARRICFGSDTPFRSMKGELDKYYELFEGKISEEDQKLILGGNIKRLFNI